MSMSSDLDEVARDLRRAGSTAGRQARGITAKALDQAAAAAQGAARTKWNRTGTASGESANSIRARMSTSIGGRGGGRQVGFLFVDGGGAFQETGTGHHPPNPVLADAVESVLPWMTGKFESELGPFNGNRVAGRIRS